MSGLVVKLKPFEKILVNGAVLQNGSRAARLRVRTPSAAILRLRDALHPNEAHSPAGRIYFIAQLAVAGEVDPEKAAAELEPLLEAATKGAETDEERAAFGAAREAVTAGRIFSAMRAMKPLLEGEKQRSSDVK